MSEQDHDQTKLIKKYLEKDVGPYNPEQSLKNALKAAKTRNATRDILSLFTGWVWVVFAGFGSSVYAEVNKRKHSTKKNKQNKKSNHTKKDIG